ncbi:MULTISPECIES: nuclear transport factor 2 family protein [unclassified Rhodococcus (in: high G+C Gram-positive bacteria)]|uniref:nuclear transport factor 2 family protein n=1 Tax=unclassified Rhodococcus (in: high G+C Gram-positive bacteria) TaxID=192944 RepID=UPI000B9BC0E7|nr:MULTISPECIES: nuclear transport factor 2 family protein [unclassified Rhodococcus (in: high G+C Gram-positive bacteria)]OZE39987.1 hypothetical protein CH259_04830 [Rhodococcus sp. 05-2254-4]OZE49555.1 hypothetical protein CH261_03265 [Rhodococcus sp. 05-2254-3]OZE50193.1 hypothetical protein CH283_10570 [Rhodococcus sp. 05-2254-2]
MTPTDVVHTALQHLLAHDMTAFADLWAVDGVIVFPFAAPGYPRRVEGRAAIHEYMRGYPEILDIRNITSPTIHETADAEVVVVEFEAAGVVPSTGKPYELAYIAVITVRDGEITKYKDYWSPLAAAEALGSVDDVTAAFAGDRA